MTRRLAPPLTPHCATSDQAVTKAMEPYDRWPGGSLDHRCAAGSGSQIRRRPHFTSSVRRAPSLRLSEVGLHFVCSKWAFTSSVRSAPSLPVFEVPSLCLFEVGLHFVYPKCAFTSSIRSAPLLRLSEARRRVPYLKCLHFICSKCALNRLSEVRLYFVYPKCENSPLSSDHSWHFPVALKLFERDCDGSDQV